MKFSFFRWSIVILSEAQWNRHLWMMNKIDASLLMMNRSLAALEQKAKEAK